MQPYILPWLHPALGEAESQLHTAQDGHEDIVQGDEQYTECIISQPAVPLPTDFHHSTTTMVVFAIT